MLEFFFILVDFLHTTLGNPDLKHCNLDRSVLNCNTLVLEFFFGLVEFLYTTSGNPDLKHFNLGRSDLNCIG